MKRLLFFIAFPGALIFGVGIWTILQNRAVAVPEKIKTETAVEQFQKPENQSTQVLQKEFSFENVSFVYGTDLFSGVKGEVIPAEPMTDVTDKPDYVYPKHTNLTFFDSYPEKYSEKHWNGVTVKICRVSDFNQSVSISKEFERISKTNFNELGRILRHDTKFSPSGNKQLIFIPWWDSSQAFHSRARVINFQNGKGLLFLTQLQQEQTIINNKGLMYVFQGLTNDNKHFVLMLFPVSGNDLPKSDNESYPEKYEKLNDYMALLNSYQHLYKNYTTETAVKINLMPPEISRLI